MDKPALKIDFTGWNISQELEKTFKRAVLDHVGLFVADLLTGDETFAVIQPDGLRVEAPELSCGITIPWAYPLDINGDGALSTLEPLFRFLGERLDGCDLSEEDRAKLRAMI